MITDIGHFQEFERNGSFKSHCLELWQPEFKALRDVGLSMCSLSTFFSPYGLGRRSDTEPEHFNLMFILKGKLSLETPDRDYTLHPGDFVVIPSTTHRRLTLLSGSCFQHAYFRIKGDNPHNILKHQNVAVKPSLSANHIERILMALLDKALHTDATKPILEKYADLLALWLTQEMSNFHPQVEYETLKEFASLWLDVKHQPTLDWTVATMAKRFSLSIPHFLRLCSKIYGDSPKQKVIAIRMSLAKDFLASTAIPLKTISSEVGYNSEYSFSTAFRKQEGLRPGEYRRRIQIH